QNIKKRLQFAKDHEKWTTDQWKDVLFSDEAQFTLHWKGQRLVWRRKNEKYHPQCLQSSVKHDKKINVWGCFSASGVGDIYRIQGNMNAKMYKNILIHQMIPSATRLFNGKEFFFQHDNDPKHTSKIVKNYLKYKRITVISWPSQSPDLNPIENIWAEINRKTKN